MNSYVFRLAYAALLAGGLWAQDGAARHNLEIGGGGVIPLSGYISEEYSAGPAGRAGYELRLIKTLGAEVGFTEAGPRGTECDRFGCTHPRETLKLLDYGLRGHLVLNDGRIDLSAGLGGGYVWHEYGDSFINVALFQYSAKAQSLWTAESASGSHSPCALGAISAAPPSSGSPPPRASLLGLVDGHSRLSRQPVLLRSGKTYR